MGGGDTGPFWQRRRSPVAAQLPGQQAGPASVPGAHHLAAATQATRLSAAMPRTLGLVTQPAPRLAKEPARQRVVGVDPAGLAVAADKTHPQLGQPQTAGVDVDLGVLL